MAIGLPVCVDEFHSIRDTPSMIQAILERYPGYTILVYPDATGQYARTTVKTTETDVSLLKMAGFKVVTETTNPAIKDRVNSMNAMLLNSNGERRYRVNVERCPFYTKALERQIYDEKGKPLKPDDDLYSHILDAGGYFIHRKYPVTRSVRGDTYIPRAIVRATR